MKFFLSIFWILFLLSRVGRGLRIYIENKRNFCWTQPTNCIGTEQEPFGTFYGALRHLEEKFLEINSEHEEVILLLKNNNKKESFSILESEILETSIFDPLRLIRGT
jgi:hypothetical protein